MFKPTLFLCVSLAASTLLTFQSQAQCPGNIHSLHATFVLRSQIIVPVRVNGAGPYDFLLDTGSLITMVDPALASELDLKPQASIGVVAVTQVQRAPIAIVDTLSVDSHVIQKPLLVTHDLSQLQASNPRLRGILGQNFLAHFDLLIDYDHKLLCLDETKRMQPSLGGEHVPLVEPQNRETDFPFAQPLLIHARLGSSAKQRLLRLDSGANMPLLYDNDQETPAWLQRKPALTTHVVGGSGQTFTLLPPWDIHVGSHSFSQVSFIAPVTNLRGRSNAEEDGLLPTSLLQRIFVSYVDHFVIIAPK
jgi:hypothetical protein